jgi:hypothetical protein
MTQGKAEFLKTHIEHARHNQLASLSDAKFYKTAWRIDGKFSQFLEYRQAVRVAWNMRRIARQAAKELKAS